MRVLVTGGRDFDERNMLAQTLDRLHEQHGFTLLIHGAAKGADRLAGEWAKSRGIEILACPADWRRYGRGAGMQRNKEMLEQSPDLLVAFPGGKGTENMVKIAKKAGLTVVMAEDGLHQSD